MTLPTSIQQNLNPFLMIFDNCFNHCPQEININDDYGNYGNLNKVFSPYLLVNSFCGWYSLSFICTLHFPNIVGFGDFVLIQWFKLKIFEFQGIQTFNNRYRHAIVISIHGRNLCIGQIQ